MKDDAGADTEVILDVAAGVGKLGAEPAHLGGAEGDMRGEWPVGSAADLQGEAERARGGTVGSGEDAVEAVRLADETLTEEEDGMFAGSPRDEGGVARAAGRWGRACGRAPRPFWRGAGGP
jgi:hypothetical protein